MFVVVDGKEKKQSDGIVIFGGEVIFNPLDNHHYLAIKGNSIYLVEEGIE